MALRKKSGELFFFFNTIQDGRQITCYYEEFETTYPGHMLIRFWCDSDITFSRGLHKKLVTALYISIINVLCGAARDASFAPQANLVFNIFQKLHYLTF